MNDPLGAADVKAAELDKQIREGELSSPFTIPSDLEAKGYYVEDAVLYAPLKLMDNNERYYLKIGREFPSKNSKKTYCYSYYDKMNDTVLSEAINSDVSIYNYDTDENLKELNKIDKAVAKPQRVLNKLLGMNSRNIPKIKDNGGDNFVKDNLLRISKDLNKEVQKGNWIQFLKSDFNIEDVPPVEEEEQEQQEPLYNIEDVVNNAEDFIKYLKTKEIDVSNYLYHKSLWISNGEIRNTLICNCANLSTYLGIRAINIIVAGKTAEGKTFVLICGKTAIPKEVFVNGQTTNAALFRSTLTEGEDYLNCKVMEFGDLGAAKDKIKYEETLATAKKLNTDHFADYKVTSDSINKTIGERDTNYMVVKGQTAYNYSDVDSENQDNQNTNRGVFTSPEATDKDVKLFRRYNRGKNKKQRDKIIKEDIEGNIINYFRFLKHKFQYNLDENKIFDEEGNIVEFINPFYLCYEEWSFKSEYYRRSDENFEAMLNTITLMNYPFRENIVKDGYSYFVTAKEDIELLNYLFNPVDEISPVAKKLFNTLIDFFNKTKWDNLDDYNKAAENEYEEYEYNKKKVNDFKYLFTVGSLKSKISQNKNSGIDKNKIGEMLDSLNQNNYINDIGTNRKGHNIYSLVELKKTENINIAIDNDKIMKWCKDIPKIYGVELEHIPKKEDDCTSYNNNKAGYDFPAWQKNEGDNN